MWCQDNLTKRKVLINAMENNTRKGNKKEAE